MAAAQKYIFSISFYTSNIGTIEGSNVEFCSEMGHKLSGSFIR